MIGRRLKTSDRFGRLCRRRGQSPFCRRIFVADVERLGIGTGGLVLRSEPLVGKPAAGPGPHILRIELHRLVEIARRRLIVADGEIAQRSRDPWFGIAVFETDRGREIVDGELVLLPALIEQTAIVIGVGVVRLERDRLVEIAERIGGAALLAIDDAAAEISRRIVDVDRQRLVIVGERESELIGLAIDQSAVGIGLRVIGSRPIALLKSASA